MGYRERAERPLNPVPGVLCLATHWESQALLARLLKEYTEVMANVATVFLRIVSAGERAVAVSHAAIVRALLGEDDSSYCVPLVIGFRNRCTDVQIGRRWSPGELAEICWRRLETETIRIFVRWHSSGGDFDEIYEVDGTGRQAPRGCRYAFDEIAVRYRVRPEDAPPSSWAFPSIQSAARISVATTARRFLCSVHPDHASRNILSGCTV